MSESQIPDSVYLTLKHCIEGAEKPLSSMHIAVRSGFPKALVETVLSAMVTRGQIVIVDICEWGNLYSVMERIKSNG